MSFANKRLMEPLALGANLNATLQQHKKPPTGSRVRHRSRKRMLMFYMTTNVSTTTMLLTTLLLLLCQLNDSITHLTLALSQNSPAPPRITIQPNDLVAIEGESAELNCDAEGDPEPTIEWFHNGELIKTSSQTRTTMGGSIQFLDIRPPAQQPPVTGAQVASSALSSSNSQRGNDYSDAGTYHCLASNAFGSTRSRNATLQVACK